MGERDIHVTLVLEIEKHPCLYNTSLPEYGIKMNTVEAWQEVSKNTQILIHDCKEKWRNIRCTFRRSLKPSRNGSVKKTYYLSRYLNFILPFSKPIDECLFRDDVSSQDGDEDVEQALTVIVKDENIEDSVKEEQDPIPVASSDCLVTDVQENSNRHCQRTPSLGFSLPESSKKTSSDFLFPESSKQFDANVERHQDDKEHMKYFFLSILPEFSNMSEQQTRFFKIKVLQLIDDIKTDRPPDSSSRKY